MKVSVLIPSYGHARYLRECLGSVQKQILTAWEAVFVDDGSPDESVGIARSVAASDPRFRIYENPLNLGTYGTEQRALELSTGEYVAILNSDDAWEAQKLTRQVELLERYPQASFCYSRGKMVGEDGSPFPIQNQHADWPVEECQNLLPYLLRENRVLASSVVFRREGLRFNPTLRYSGDWVAALEAVQRGPSLFVDEPLCIWRIHAENSHQRSRAQVLEEIRVRLAIRDLAGRRKGHADQAKMEHGRAENLVHLQALAMLCGDRRLAWQSIWSAGAYPNRAVLWKRRLAAFLPMKFVQKQLFRGQSLNLRPADIRHLPPLDIA